MPHLASKGGGQEFESFRGPVAAERTLTQVARKKSDLYVINGLCYRNLIWRWGFRSRGSGSGSGGRSPRLDRFTSEDAERAVGYEMASNVESVMNGGMTRQEALS
jgi:hypothetical protein